MARNARLLQCEQNPCAVRDADLLRPDADVLIWRDGLGNPGILRLSSDGAHEHLGEFEYRDGKPCIARPATSTARTPQHA